MAEEAVARLAESQDADTTKLLLRRMLRTVRTPDYDMLRGEVEKALTARPGDIELLAARLIIAAESESPMIFEDVSAIQCPLIVNHVVQLGRMKAASRIASAMASQKGVRSLKTLGSMINRAPVKPILMRRFRDRKKADVQVFRSRQEDARTIVLCFCGIAHMMGVQINAFQLWLLRAHTHVAYLRDRHNMLYLNGIKSIGGFEETLDNLRSEIGKLGAERVVCIGSSGGSFGALQYAPLLGAMHVICFAGPTNMSLAMENSQERRFHSVVVGRYNEAGIRPPDLHELYKAHPEIRVRYICGANNDFDVTQGRYLADLPSVDLVELVDYEAHNVLPELLRLKQLGPEFQYAITGVKPEELNGRPVRPRRRVRPESSTQP